MIKGCVGFTYISGRLFGDMLIVKGKRVISVPLPIGVYHIMNRLSRRKNILGKILFKNSTDFKGILESKKD